MFPFCEKSIPHQWECFRNQNYFALSAAAAAGLLLRVCSAGFASASFASAGRASAGCVPQGVFRRRCFTGIASAGIASASFASAGLFRGFSASPGQMSDAAGRPAGSRTRMEAFRRRSGGVRATFGQRSGGVRVQASAVGSVPARRRFSNSRTAGRPSRGSWQSIRCGRCASLLTRISKKRSPRKGS